MQILRLNWDLVTATQNLMVAHELSDWFMHATPSIRGSTGRIHTKELVALREIRRRLRSRFDWRYSACSASNE